MNDSCFGVPDPRQPTGNVRAAYQQPDFVGEAGVSVQELLLVLPLLRPDIPPQRDGDVHFRVRLGQEPLPQQKVSQIFLFLNQSKGKLLNLIHEHKLRLKSRLNF